MSILDITDFELEVQEFYAALNCSFMYAFSLCRLVFLYKYLKKCVTRYTWIYYALTWEALYTFFSVFFIDKMDFCNEITSCTILTLVQLYSGIFYTTFLTTRMMFIRIAYFQKSISRLKMYS